MLWGQLVFDIRNLARASTSLIEDRERHRPLLMNALAFCHVLRGQLRNVDATPEASAFLGSEEAATGSANPADQIVRRMGKQIGTARREGHHTTASAIASSYERLRGSRRY